MTRGALLILSAALLLGCESPRVIARAETGPIEALEGAIEQGDAYEPRWKAAAACLDVVERPGTASSQRLAYARRALKHADRAVELDPTRVEGHFYRAVALGQVLDNETLKDLSRIGELERAGQRARAIDPAFRNAGPLRLLALLYQKAPPYPLGPALARQEDVIEELFREAIRRAPEHVENHLCFAEFLKEEDRRTEARASAGEAQRLLPLAKGLEAWQRRDLEQRLQQLLQALRS